MNAPKARGGKGRKWSPEERARRQAARFGRRARAVMHLGMETAAFIHARDAARWAVLAAALAEGR